MMRAGWIALAGLLLLGMLLGTPITTAIARETRDEIAQRQHWQRTFSHAREELARAKQSLNDARIAYQNMRHHRRVRGDEKQKIIDAVPSGERELARAQEALDAARVAARRAGVPPGWIRVKDAGPLPASGAKN